MDVIVMAENSVLIFPDADEFLEFMEFLQEQYNERDVENDGN